MQQCKGSGPNGRCPELAADGSEYCEACLEWSALSGQKSPTDLGDSLLRDDISRRMASHDILGLEFEIATAESMHAKMVGMIKTRDDFLLFQPRIEAAATNIKNLKAAHSKALLEQSQVMTRGALVEFARGIIDTCNDELAEIDGEVIGRISERIRELVMNTKNKEESGK